MAHLVENVYVGCWVIEGHLEDALVGGLEGEFGAALSIIWYMQEVVPPLRNSLNNLYGLKPNALYQMSTILQEFFARLVPLQ